MLCLMAAFAFSTAALTLTGCESGGSEQTDVEKPGKPGDEDQKPDVPTPPVSDKMVRLYATIADLTRVSMVSDIFLWSQGEMMAAAEICDNNTDDVTSSTVSMAVGTPTSDFKAAYFDFYPDDNDEATVFDYMFCYPYSAFKSFTPGEKVVVTLPSEQTLTAMSFDASAALMFAHYEGLDSRPKQLQAEMKHLSAYVKLTVKNLGLPSTTRVSKITFESEGSETLAGSYEYCFNNPEQSVKGDGKTVITLNTSQAVINTARNFDVWFTALPATATNYTITITADGQEYKRTFENTSVTFEAGHVSEIEADFVGLVERPSVSGTVYKYVKCDNWTVGKNFIVAVQIDGIYYTLANDISFQSTVPAVSFQDAGIGEGLDYNTFVCNNDKYLWYIEATQREIYHEDKNYPALSYTEVVDGYTFCSATNPTLYFGYSEESRSFTVSTEASLIQVSTNPYTTTQNIVKDYDRGEYVVVLPDENTDAFKWSLYVTIFANYAGGSGEIIFFEQTDRTE